MSAPLTEAYTRAAYRLLLPDGVHTRRIGVVDAAADEALRAADCRSHWHLITPCNPRSQALDAAQNTERLRQLALEIDAHGWPHVAAINESDDGRWREAGYAIFDAYDEVMRALAIRYEQNALVHARLGEAPALIWLL